MKLFQKIDLAHRKAESFLGSEVDQNKRDEFVASLLKMPQDKFESEVKDFISADRIGGDDAGIDKPDTSYEVTAGKEDIKREKPDTQKNLPGAGKAEEMDMSDKKPLESAEKIAGEGAKDETYDIPGGEKSKLTPSEVKSQKSTSSEETPAEELDASFLSEEEVIEDEEASTDEPAEEDEEVIEDEPTAEDYSLSVDIEDDSIKSAIKDFKEFLLENSSNPEEPSEEDLSNALASLEKQYGSTTVAALILKADASEVADAEDEVEIEGDIEDEDYSDEEPLEDDADEVEESESADQIDYGESETEKADKGEFDGYMDSEFASEVEEADASEAVESSDQPAFTSGDKESPVEFLFGSAEADAKFAEDNSFVSSEKPKKQRRILKVPDVKRKSTSPAKSSDSIDFDIAFGSAEA